MENIKQISGFFDFSTVIFDCEILDILKDKRLVKEGKFICENLFNLFNI